VPVTLPGNAHVFAQYVVRSRDRDALASALARAGVPTQVHYALGLHQQPLFSAYAAAAPTAEQAAREVLSLPLYPGLTRIDQDRVIEAVLDFVQRTRRK
jgi:dTDP-4-amino-4,6-dideoxygalactose transaminase